MTMKLLLLGDSIFGRLNDGMLSQMENLVFGLKILNSARGGMKSLDLAESGLSGQEVGANFIAISVGMNDCYHDVSVADFANNLDRLLDDLSNKINVLVLPPPPVDTIRHGEEGTRYNGKLKKYYIAEMSKVSNRTNVIFLDVWDDLISLMDKGIDFHEDDGVHLNQIGYEYVFSAIVKNIHKY